MTDGPIRIANCSGFYGDRLSAAAEMVEGGPIDALTGDWLAELTMLILSRVRSKRPGGGYARSFVTQMEQTMGRCLDDGVKVVSNAGGLDPAGCADAIHEVADTLGLSPSIAIVTGDDLLPRLDELVAAGVTFDHLDTGAPLADRRSQLVTANAYLGCWGIVDALDRGADIVITGRVTDAAVVMGPAAWHHRWERTDWDALAGAITAGHVIECGAQVTGGNYAFFTEIADMSHPGFPIAEIAADGSSVITKHPETGGEVNIGTVTSQLLYEIGGPRYLNPDAVARFDSIQLEQLGPDRVRIGPMRGEPAPATLKVGANLVGGYRNGTTLCLTGLDIDAKAALIEEQLWSLVPGGRDSIAEVSTELIRTDKATASRNEEATALYRITVKDPDEHKVGRRFSNASVQIALASIPGLYGLGPPGGATPYGVFWPALVPSEHVPQTVTVDGVTSVVDNTPFTASSEPTIDLPSRVAPPTGATVEVPLGRVLGARSGDKGGTANLGVFARSAPAYAWMAEFLTMDRLRELLPHETGGHAIERHELANMWALNFLIIGLLDEGVAASTRLDGQAKSLGEFLRSRTAPVPAVLL
ncbi:MAG: DUF1446 domain-containing protein [Acidimicrobiia bacterium]|nr:DUF1446 domain-containing protein [Acidimicrobiia bacterium]